jgi:hypothetical protein
MGCLARPPSAAPSPPVGPDTRDLQNVRHRPSPIPGRPKIGPPCSLESLSLIAILKIERMIPVEARPRRIVFRTHHRPKRFPPPGGKTKEGIWPGKLQPTRPSHSWLAHARPVLRNEPILPDR